MSDKQKEIFISFKKKLLELHLNAKFDSLFRELTNYCFSRNDVDELFISRLLNLNSRFSNLKNAEALGIVSRENFNLELNKIIVEIPTLIRDLPIKFDNVVQQVILTVDSEHDLDEKCLEPLSFAIQNLIKIGSEIHVKKSQK